MSIALEAKVTALESRCETLFGHIIELQTHLLATNEALLNARERLSMLEQTAQRKPGPKPKDSNG